MHAPSTGRPVRLFHGISVSTCRSPYVRVEAQAKWPRDRQSPHEDREYSHVLVVRRCSLPCGMVDLLVNDGHALTTLSCCPLLFGSVVSSKLASFDDLIHSSVIHCSVVRPSHSSQSGVHATDRLVLTSLQSYTPCDHTTEQLALHLAPLIARAAFGRHCLFLRPHAGEGSLPRRQGREALGASHCPLPLSDPRGHRGQSVQRSGPSGSV